MPAYPVTIGVITSPTGAAIRDILTTLKRRYPIAQVTVIPTVVQGEQAAPSITEAIHKANSAPGDYDVLIVGRGGGSMEDLWGFNEEMVARAIFTSHIPIISAVGHETDITISDFTADVRAATPSGAAEIAVPSIKDLKEKLDILTKSVRNNMANRFEHDKKRLEQFNKAYAFRYPKQLSLQKEQELDRIVDRLERITLQQHDDKTTRLDHLLERFRLLHPERQMQEANRKLELLTKQCVSLMNRHTEEKHTELHTMMDKLTLLNPLEIMKRGYAIPYKETEQIIRSVEEVKVDDQIQVTIHDGILNCHVTDIEGDNQ